MCFRSSKVEGMIPPEGKGGSWMTLLAVSGTELTSACKASAPLSFLDAFHSGSLRAYRCFFWSTHREGQSRTMSQTLAMFHHMLWAFPVRDRTAKFWLKAAIFYLPSRRQPFCFPSLGRSKAFMRCHLMGWIRIGGLGGQCFDRRIKYTQVYNLPYPIWCINV